MSRYSFEPLSEDLAEEIIRWHYEGLYSFYDMKADEQDLVDFLDSDNWGKIYFAVKDGKDLIGYFAYTFINGIMWIGLGLKPTLTGCGRGVQFVKEGIHFGLEHFKYEGKCIKLAVAATNKRAIAVFEKVGFSILEHYYQKTNGSEYEFVKMELKLG